MCAFLVKLGKAAIAPAVFVVDVAKGENVASSLGKCVGTVVAPVEPIVTAAIAPAVLVKDVATGKNIADSVVKCVGTVVAPIEPIVTAPVKCAVSIGQGKNVLEAVGQMAIDVVPLAGEVQKAIQNKHGRRVLIHDYSDGRGFLGVTWDIAGAYEQGNGRFDDVIAAKSWAHVAKELLRICERHGEIYEIQFWGHGCPGIAFIGKDELTKEVLATWSMRHLFVSNGVIWFRTCSTMNEDDGRAFAHAVAGCFGDITVAGHTKFIHAIHEGLVVKKPGRAADWKNESGSWCLCTDMEHHEIGNM